MKKYIAFGIDGATRKKVEISVQAKNSSQVQRKLNKQNPRVLVQGVYPDLSE